MQAGRSCFVARCCATVVAAVALVACNMLPKAPVGDEPTSAKGGDPGALGLPPTPTAAAAPAVPRDPAAAQRLVTGAVEHLQAGNEDTARQDLQQALSLDPQNARAQSLWRQITTDPVSLLGRESFPYVIKPGDSLSGLAGRFLGDMHSFYALARYNDIKVPRQVAVGQSLRIPGKAPAPEPVRPAPPPPRVETRAPAAPAPTPVVAAASAPDPAVVKAKADEARLQLVGHHTRRAREAFARQDLEGAIREWDQVLAHDAGNAVALVERKRAVDLLDKVIHLRR
jgi:LysM repeat protein